MSAFPAVCDSTPRPAGSGALDGAPPPTASHLTGAQLRSLRRLLVVNRAAHRAEVARHAAALAAASLGSPAGDANLDRATSALHMYVAWETVEEFDEALARVEAGVYGTCLSCARSIPFERLETSPQMRFCPTCDEARSEPPRRRAVARRRRS